MQELLTDSMSNIPSAPNQESTEQMLIYRKKAEKILGVGTTKFYELMKIPGFPKPKVIYGSRPMFLRKQIEEWALNLGN